MNCSKNNYASCISSKIDIKIDLKADVKDTEPYLIIGEENDKNLINLQ